MVEPHNIKRLKEREQSLFSFGEDVKSNALASTRAAWFEAQALKKTNPKEAEKELSTMDEDLRLAAEQLTRVRRERLREQFASEMAAWQRELASLRIGVGPTAAASGTSGR